MTIYIYKKTHNQTGLMYLGKTNAADPHKYKGSGKIWMEHIKKHGYDVTTEILKECKNNNEVKNWGIYYSELWNIVNARDENGRKIWANLKQENGDGGWDHVNNDPSKYERPDCSGKNSGMFGKQHSSDSIKLMSKNRSGKGTGKHSTSHIANRRKSRCKKYKLISPTGVEYLTTDLKEFCELHNLIYKTIYKLPNRKKGNIATSGACSGWLCVKA